MSRALHWVEERLEEPVTLADIAAVAGLSPHHFHRIFRAVVGESPKAHLRRLRLERAVYRLKVSSDTVLDIALESGFATPETFTRAFVRRFELSPSEYRGMVRAYREYVDVAQQSKTFEGFAAETPLTLRFDFDAAPVWVEPASSLMLRPSGAAWMATVSAPSARSAATAVSEAAPFAQSTTTFRPSRLAPSPSDPTRWST